MNQVGRNRLSRDQNLHLSLACVAVMIGFVSPANREKVLHLEGLSIGVSDFSAVLLGIS